MILILKSSINHIFRLWKFHRIIYLWFFFESRKSFYHLFSTCLCVLYCAEVTCFTVFIGIICSLSLTYVLKQLNSARLEGDNIMVNFSHMLNFLHVKWLKVCWPTVFSTSWIKCILLLLSAYKYLKYSKPWIH